MALDFSPKQGMEGQQEPSGVWPGYNSHYGFKPTQDAHSLFGSPAFSEDNLVPSFHIKSAPQAAQPVVVKKQQQQHNNSQSMQQMSDHLHSSLAPHDYLTPSPLSSMLSPESTYSYLPMQSEAPDIDFISQSHHTSLHGHFLDMHLGSEQPQPAQSSGQSSFSGSCQMLSRSAPDMPFQSASVQHPWVPKHRALPMAAARPSQWHPQLHSGLVWTGSGCSPDLSHVSQVRTDRSSALLLTRNIEHPPRKKDRPEGQAP